MMPIDQFFDILKNICDELPEEFFRDLHHGVVLDPGLKISPHARSNDLIIMGEYQASPYGNRIVIYYGSFERTCAGLAEDEITERLCRVVRHEFRHHLENLSGMHGADSLEREDQIQLREYKRSIE